VPVVRQGLRHNLLDLGGRPVITYGMDHLLEIGVERFIVNTHHRPEVFLETFPDGQWRGRPVLFRHEPVLLDTAGGLKNIEDLLEDDEAILCYNGDVVADLPLAPLLRTHDAKRPEATLLLRSRGPALNVALDGGGAVCDLRGALGAPGARLCLFTGIYALETSLLEHIEAGRVASIVPVLIDRIRRRPGSVAGVVVDQGRWCDIGSAEAYEGLRHRIDGRGRP